MFNRNQWLKVLAGAGAGLVGLGGAVLSSQAAPIDTAPTGDTDRFEMSPVEGGFVRLDKETGAMSLCSKSEKGWGCAPITDPPGALSKLREENEALRKRIQSLEQNNGSANNRAAEGDQTEGGMAEGGPSGEGPDNPALGEAPSDGQEGGGPPGGISRMPTEKDIDHAFDYLERMYRKLRERFKDLDKPPPAGDDAPTDDDGQSL